MFMWSYLFVCLMFVDLFNDVCDVLHFPRTNVFVVVCSDVRAPNVCVALFSDVCDVLHFPGNNVCYSCAPGQAGSQKTGTGIQEKLRPSRFENVNR